MANLALYIHWPYCKAKCPYCDFNSHVAQKIDYPAWEQAYATTLSYWANELPGRKITSIFFGGGTPSLMPSTLVKSILTRVRDQFDVSQDCEITLEANPTSSEAQTFEAFSQAGVNRLSLGIQSLRANRLAFLGREHSASEALQALSFARDNFARYSFDLIYAQPEQTISQWHEELDEALTYAQGHLSLYQLTIEENTAFHTRHARGDFIMPKDDLAADFYERTGKTLRSRGYESYELSNYAQSGHESLHNLAYWNYRDYLGIGPGAHSRVSYEDGRSAIYMVKAPDTWLKNVKAHASGVKTQTPISKESAFDEALLMGARLKEGVRLSRLQEIDLSRAESLTSSLKTHWLCEDRFVDVDEGYIRIREDKRILTNRIIQYLCELR